MLRLLFITSLLLLPLFAKAQEQLLPNPPPDTINADRPDQTESPHIVPVGSLQAEGGITLNPFDSAGGQPAPLVGMLVLRYGLGQRLEVRAMIEDGRGRDRFLDETTQGVFPLAVGSKLLLYESERGPIPQVALLAWLKLPFTSRTAQQKAYWSPQVLMAFENKIGERIEIEYNAGAKQEVYGPRWQGMGSASVHLEITDRLKLFAEYFGQYQPGEVPMHNADGGLMFLVTPVVQVDVSAGRTLGAAWGAANSFVMVGASARL